jgi:plasmid stabilization system protein ParE
MDFALIWTESALSDLEQIVRYYRDEQKSADAALRVGTEIVERVEVLKSFPDIGPLYPKKSGIHREVLCFDYRIFYRVDRDAKIVYIARVWHGSQDLGKLVL